jgi:hypothetical protein
MYIGAPYYAQPLTDEIHDWLPYPKTNCTMFILYATAFVNSHSLQEACEHMRRLHYKGGIVGFKTRYHFTVGRISDPDNRYFSAVTEQYIKNPADLKLVTLILNKKSNGPYLFGGQLNNWHREVTIKYLPKEGFNPDMFRKLPKSIGIAFVKRSNWEIGAIVGHEGLLIDRDLYHSSPSSGVCVIKDFLKTEFPNSLWAGKLS